MRFLLIIMILTSVHAFDISGIWKLSSAVKHRPFTFCALVTYGLTIKFNTDETISIIKKQKTNITETKRKYKLKAYDLNVFLDNEQMGMLPNFFLHHSSTNQTFKLHHLSENCYLAVDQNNKNNRFKMCKKY